MQEGLNTLFWGLTIEAFEQQGLYVHSRYSKQLQCSTEETFAHFQAPGYAATNGKFFIHGSPR